MHAAIEAAEGVVLCERHEVCRQWVHGMEQCAAGEQWLSGRQHPQRGDGGGTDEGAAAE